MDKYFWKAALIRAIHAFWQTLAALLPVGVVVTPKMITELDWSILLIVLAWFLTALIAAVFSFIKSVAAGLPEVALADTLDALSNDPESIEDEEEEEYEDSFDEDGDI